MNPRNLLITLCTLLIFSGCKKGLSGETFVIKFEVISSTPITNPAIVNTKIGLMGLVTNTDFTSGTTWSKSTTIETAYRPIDLLLGAQNLFISSPGSATASIYVDGVLKATTTNQSFVINNQNQVTTQAITYIIQ